MEIRINRKDLINRLDIVNSARNRKSDMLLHKLVKISMTDSTMEFTVVSDKMIVRTLLNINSNYNGETCIEISPFLSILKSIKQDYIIIKTSSGNISIISDRGKFDFKMENTSIFPVIDFEHGNDKFYIDPKDTYNMINKVLFCIPSESEYKPQLTNGLMEMTEKSISLVGTDGDIFSKFSNTSMKSKYINKDIMIPRQSLNILMNVCKYLSNTDQLILSSVSDHTITFTAEGVSLMCLLSNDNYPDYSMIIPKDNDKSITVNRQQMVEAVQRIVSLTKEDDKAIKIRLDILGVVLETPKKNIGYGCEEIDGKWEYKDIIIGINGVHLYSIISSIEDEEIVINIKDKNKPISIMSEKDKDVIYILRTLDI